MISLLLSVMVKNFEDRLKWHLFSQKRCIIGLFLVLHAEPETDVYDSLSRSLFPVFFGHTL